MSKPSRYDRRGVSSQKEDVHAAIKNLDKGLYPKAFCKIIPDILGGDEAWCNIMHADGAGTKSALAYLYWKETGDLSVWRGIAQDAVVMNLDDLLCVGVTGNILLSSTIGRNKNLIPGDVGPLERRRLVASHGGYADDWLAARLNDVSMSLREFLICLGFGHEATVPVGCVAVNSRASSSAAWLPTERPRRA